jgi:hypothetical protein
MRYFTGSGRELTGWHERQCYVKVDILDEENGIQINLQGERVGSHFVSLENCLYEVKMGYCTEITKNQADAILAYYNK